MKPEITNHEILLFTGTRFTSRELCSRDNEKDNGRINSPIEKLEKACWDGLLYELFPDSLSESLFCHYLFHYLC